MKNNLPPILYSLHSNPVRKPLFVDSTKTKRLLVNLHKSL